MGFFSDPAAKQVPTDFLPDTPTPPTKERRRRSVEDRKQRRQQRDSKRRDSDGLIPSTEGEATEDKSRPLRRSSSVVSIKDIAANNRRGSSTRSSLYLDGIGGIFSDSSKSSNQDSGSLRMSMKDHLEELESFVLHVKNSDKKQQKKILRRASRCDLNL